MAAPRFAVPPGGVVSKGLVYTDQQVAQTLPPASLADYSDRKAAMAEDGKGNYVSIGGRLYPMWWLLAGGGALLLGGLYIVTR